jgi:hypothetical protein
MVPGISALCNGGALFSSNSKFKYTKKKRRLKDPPVGGLMPWSKQ